MTDVTDLTVYRTFFSRDLKNRYIENKEDRPSYPSIHHFGHGSEASVQEVLGVIFSSSCSTAAAQCKSCLATKSTASCSDVMGVYCVGFRPRVRDAVVIPVTFITSSRCASRVDFLLRSARAWRVSSPCFTLPRAIRSLPSSVLGPVDRAP